MHQAIAFIVVEAVIVAAMVGNYCSFGGRGTGRFETPSEVVAPRFEAEGSRAHTC